MSNLETASLLKLLRNNNNYTIQKIATLLGVSKAAVSKWENGDDISTENLYNLSKLYGVSFSELYYGKLDSEDNCDYWRRNYDLSNFELKEDITSKNVENLKNLFEHIIMVKNRFYKLLPKWANNNLSSTEAEEFNFIKQYFKFDYSFHSNVVPVQKYLKTMLNEFDEKHFILEYLNSIEKLDEDSYKWELEKIFDFNYDFKAKEICESGNLKAVEYMLESLSQIEKDNFLYGNLHIREEKEVESPFGSKTKQISDRDKTDDEIEQTAYFKLMFNAGANCFYRRSRIKPFLDDVALDKIEGKIVEVDNTIQYRYSFINAAGYESVPVLENWKSFSYEQYLSFVDEDETDRLKDIVNLKDSNPLKYYKNMVKRNKI